MTRRRVAVVGAFDRFNYGDLLFPIVTRRALGQLGRTDCEFQDFALTRSDLSRFGAHKTRSLADLRTFVRPNDVVLMAGGGILGTRWSNMLIHSSSAPTGFVVKAIRKTLGIRSAEALARSITNNRLLRLPWIYEPEDFANDVSIIYSAVGGFGTLSMLPVSDREYAWSKLRKSSYLSVRDRETQQLLVQEAGISRTVLAPDSAVLMSELFAPDELDRRCSQETRSILEQNAGGYVCLQISKAHASGEIETIASQLEILYRESGLTTVLLPVGRAPGHEDHLALTRIAERMKTPVDLPSNDIGIYDIMLLIARSGCFVGTSLHGAITALSYATPHLGLGHKVMKLRNFLRTWDVSEQQECISSESIAQGVLSVREVPQSIRERKRSELIEASWQNFQNMVEHIPSDGRTVSRLST